MYLLLENLVSRYARPCVLDLKVGVRQYADDVSAAKKQRKIAKARSTTLGTLGLRLCGMQVYNRHSGKWLCHNKYHGRLLNDDGFREAVAQFFDTRVDVVERLMERLQDLRTILQTLDSYRFYTSSLLVTYDGASESEENHDDDEVLLESSSQSSSPGVVDVRIIDFAHSTHRGLKDKIAHVGPDEGFIYGLSNFIVILRELFATEKPGEAATVMTTQSD